MWLCASVHVAVSVYFYNQLPWCIIRRWDQELCLANIGHFVATHLPCTAMEENYLGKLRTDLFLNFKRALKTLSSTDVTFKASLGIHNKAYKRVKKEIKKKKTSAYLSAFCIHELPADSLSRTKRAKKINFFIALSEQFTVFATTYVSIQLWYFFGCVGSC